MFTSWNSLCNVQSVSFRTLFNWMHQVMRVSAEIVIKVHDLQSFSAGSGMRRGSSPIYINQSIINVHHTIWCYIGRTKRSNAALTHVLHTKSICQELEQRKKHWVHHGQIHKFNTSNTLNHTPNLAHHIELAKMPASQQGWNLADISTGCSGLQGDQKKWCMLHPKHAWQRW